MEETSGRLGVSSYLQVYVHDFAILINSAPKIMLYAANHCENHALKVSVAEAGVSASKTLGKLRAEFVDPESNGFVADIDISFGE